MSSKFKALFEQANSENESVKKTSESKQNKPKDKLQVKPKKLKGKRSNPDYTGAFAYIPSKLHEDVKIKLLRRKDLDFSGLIERLLNDWLSNQK